MAIFPTRRPGWTDEQYADYLAGAEAGRRRQGNKTVAELTFRARLGAPKVALPKEKDDYLGRRIEGGTTELPLLIERPKQPAKPQKSQDLEFADGDKPRPSWSRVPAEPGEFKAPAKKRGMTQEQYDAASAQALAAYTENVEEYRAWLEELEEDRASYKRELAEYEQALSQLARDYVAYGQIPALAAVMGGLEVEVTIRPTGEGMLPGFVEQLLGLPSPSVSSEEAAGGD